MIGLIRGVVSSPAGLAALGPAAFVVGGVFVTAAAVSLAYGAIKVRRRG